MRLRHKKSFIIAKSVQLFYDPSALVAAAVTQGLCTLNADEEEYSVYRARCPLSHIVLTRGAAVIPFSMTSGGPLASLS